MTVRVGQWRPSPLAHAAQTPQAKLISAATRLPFHASGPSTTSPKSSCPRTPRKPM